MGHPFSTYAPKLLEEHQVFCVCQCAAVNMTSHFTIRASEYMARRFKIRSYVLNRRPVMTELRTRRRQRLTELRTRRLQRLQGLSFQAITFPDISILQHKQSIMFGGYGSQSSSLRKTRSNVNAPATGEKYASLAKQKTR